MDKHEKFKFLNKHETVKMLDNMFQKSLRTNGLKTCIQRLFNCIVEGAIGGPREALAHWDGEEYEEHEQDRGCWGYFDIIFMACHIVLPPQHLWRCYIQYSSLDFGTCMSADSWYLNLTLRFEIRSTDLTV